MYLSIRDEMVAGGEFESPAAGLKHLGIESVEIHLDPDFRVMSMDSTERVLLDEKSAPGFRKHLDGLGISCCSLLTARDLSEDPEAGIAWLAQAVEIADTLGCDTIRVDSILKREKELGFAERVDIFQKCLREVIHRTAGCEVALAIENHGVFGNNLAFLLNVFQGIDSPRVGSTLDTANFYWRGDPLGEGYGILKLLAPYARHTHAKNIAYPVDKREISREIGWEYGTYMSPLDEGDIDHGQVVRMLEGAGYRGDICIENESLARFAAGAARREVLERDVAHVMELIASVEQRERAT